MSDDRMEVWRRQLEVAFGEADRCVVLADMSDNNAMLSVRCPNPAHLIYIARMVIAQASDLYEEMEGDEAEEALELCGELLSMMPETADDDGE